MVRRRTPFLIAAAAGTATLVAASAPSPLYPVYQQMWGFSAFTLTLIFAVYVFALLAALLTVGSVSDLVGRRPVASAALVLLAAGMVLFALASGPGALMIARVVQGFAVGAATGTTTAMIMDTAPSSRVGSIVSSAVPSLGIAVGAVLAGGLVEHAPFPRQLVFWILVAVYLTLAVVVWTVPETTVEQPAHQRSIWRSLRPSAGLPPDVRPVFLALLPSIGATWALGGLYLSLGSSILRVVLGIEDHLVVGVVLAAFFAAGAAGAVASPALPARHSERLGYAALAVGVLITTCAMLLSSLPAYAAGSVVAGAGFGASFRYAVGALGEASPADRRGGVFATMYIVSYVAFSVPALVAGLAVGSVGLEPTAVTYGVLEVVLVLVAMVAAGTRASRRPVAADPGESSDS